jgi:hypothetical protein
MSNLYIPENETLKSSPALPHLQTCIEAVAREAIQSGCPEQDVREFLRLHDRQFEGTLTNLHGAYRLHPTLTSTEGGATNESSNRPRPSLLPAAEIVERQPSKYNDGFKSDKVEDGLDYDDEDDLASDEDAKKAGGPQEGHPHARRPHAGLSRAARKPVIAASDRLNQALGIAPQTPGFPTSRARFEASAAVDRSPDSDDRSDTPKQRKSVSDWPPRSSIPSASPLAADMGVEEDEDAQTPVQAQTAVHHSAPHPHAILPFSGRDKITDAAGSLRQVEQRGLEPLASPDVEDGNGDESDTPEQKTFVPSWPPRPGQQTFLTSNSASGPDAAGLSAVAVDPEQAKSDQGKEKVRAWDDGQAASSSGRLADPNSHDAQHRSVAGIEEAGALLDSLAETKRLSSPEATKLALHARDPVQLEKSIRAKKAGKQTEKSEMLDLKSAAFDTISPGNADETGGDHQRSSAHHADLGSGDDKSPNKTKSSPVTEAARAQLERDTDTKAEDWKAKQKGKGRERKKEALRSPVRRS